MARRRKYGEDLTYSEWHRVVLDHHYERVGHRMHMGDRDFTEICGYCRDPLLLKEEVIDRGQDLRDKAVTWTRRMAERADLPAMLVSPRIRREPEVQAEIDRLWKRLLELYHPSVSKIDAFTIRRIYPEASGDLIVMTPKEWREQLLIVHRDHHADCAAAAKDAPRVDADKLRVAQNTSRLFTPDGQMRLWLKSA